MKLIRKSVAVLIALLLMVTVIPSAFAVTAEAGDTVTVELVAQDAYGVNGSVSVSGNIVKSYSVEYVNNLPEGQGTGDENGATFWFNSGNENGSGSVTFKVKVVLLEGTYGKATVAVNGERYTKGGDVEHELALSETIVVEEPECQHPNMELKYDENGHWYECECGYKTIPEAHKAKGAATPTIPATCCSEGKGTAKCECGYDVEVTLPKTPHSWGPWVEPTLSDCEKGGTLGYKTCTQDCCAGKYFDKDGNEIADINVAPSGHKLETIKATAPDCTTPGNDEYQKCSVCGQLFDMAGNKIDKIPAIDALDHDMKKHDKVEPTCTKKGTEAYQECLRCGKLFDMNGKEIKAPAKIDALGHKWGKWEIVEEATCTEDGLRERYCTRGCGEKKTDVIEATGHEYEYEKINSKQHKATCKICGHSFKEDHEFQYNGYCVCGYKKPVASTAGLDDVPKTGDITGQLVFGASAAVIALMAAAAFVFKRKTAK